MVVVASVIAGASVVVIVTGVFLAQPGSILKVATTTKIKANIISNFAFDILFFIYFVSVLNC